MRFDSLYLRVAAVLLLGLLAAQWVADRLYREEREKVIAHLIAGPLGQRLDNVARRLDAFPAAERPELLPLLNSPRITYQLAQALLPNDPGEPYVRLHNRLRESLGEARKITVAAGRPGSPESARISLALADGQVLIAAHHYPADPALLPSRHLPLLTGYFLAIALLALLAMGWVVRPMRRLARAAEILGRDLAGAPVAETGPWEARQAARAFNTMQRRLASFLEDRLRILAAVSHDLKSPITRMKLRAEMLQEPEARERFLHDLNEMETMIAATLDFLRGESHQEAGVALDLNALLSALADDFSSQGRVEITGSASRPLQARPQALKRCLANLIDNALRYGGAAHIRMEEREGGLHIHIEDDGPGIPEADLESLFEPFRRGEASRNRNSGGVGLGLAIARNLARAHGGDVRLANRPQGGIRASLDLPL